MLARGATTCPISSHTAENYIDFESCQRVFSGAAPSWRGLPIRLDLAEAVKRQAHHLMGYLRGQWVKMALIKMERTCLGSCESPKGGWRRGERAYESQNSFPCATKRSLSARTFVCCARCVCVCVWAELEACSGCVLC